MGAEGSFGENNLEFEVRERYASACDLCIVFCHNSFEIVILASAFFWMNSRFFVIVKSKIGRGEEQYLQSSSFMCVGVKVQLKNGFYRCDLTSSPLLFAFLQLLYFKQKGRLLLFLFGPKGGPFLIHFNK